MIPNAATEAFQKGMACLKGLDTDFHISGLNDVFEASQKSKIYCSDRSHRWSGALAISSLPSDSSHHHGEKELPFISLNPDSQPKGGFAGVIFHEAFHNMGYAHFADIEYAYACSACCFPGEGGEEFQKAGCSICQMKPDQRSSEEYLKSLLTMFEKHPYKDSSSDQLRQIFVFLLENSQSDWAKGELFQRLYENKSKDLAIAFFEFFFPYARDEVSGEWSAKHKEALEWTLLQKEDREESVQLLGLKKRSLKYERILVNAFKDFVGSDYRSAIAEFTTIIAANRPAINEIRPSYATVSLAEFFIWMARVKLLNER